MAAKLEADEVGQPQRPMRQTGDHEIAAVDLGLIAIGS